MCLFIAAIICIVLTGAGRGHVISNERIDKTSDKSMLLSIEDKKEIDLDALISQKWILRINYDLKKQSKENLGVLQGYTGKNSLLGTKLPETVAFITQDGETQEWFPSLYFDAYDWFDEEKGIGIVSLVLTKGSLLAFGQLQDTTLFNEMPDYAKSNLKDCDSRSIQKTQVYTKYDLQMPIHGVKSIIKLSVPVEMTRNINVIMPEIIQ